MRGRLIVALVLIGIGAALVETQLPVLGAGGLLHPARHRTSQAAPPSCADETFNGAGVSLRGWRCAATGKRRGTIVYLHGIADNRASAAGVIQRFGRRGFDVIAYDSRAHGDSEGEACTYGFFERRDLRQVLNTLPVAPTVLIGASLGGAVALQAAAEDARVSAVVAAEVFSDLETVARERAPFFFTDGIVRKAFRRADQDGRFTIDDVSPERAATKITVPVLLIHGAADTDTNPRHSQRVYAALAGPKRLILVQGAGHNQSLREAVWTDIQEWLDTIVR